MKKLLCAIVAMAMLLATCACAEEASVASQKDISEVKIGLISDNSVAEARLRTAARCQELADEMGFTLIFQDPNMDELEQIRLVENMITMGVDALILMPVNSDAIAPAVEACDEAGIPVLCWGRQWFNCRMDAFVGSSVDYVGTMQIEYILENFPVTEPQNWILLDGPSTNPYCPRWHDQWLAGIQEYIDNDLINVVGWTEIEDADTQIAMETTENFLTAADGDVDVCMAVSDTIATGAAQALAEWGLSHIPITGLDAETIVLKRIADGTQTMTIALDDYAAGDVCINTALGLLGYVELGEPDDYLDNGWSDAVPCYYSQPVIVTAENLAEVIEMGYGTPEEVYADVPLDQWPEQFK